ncbi:MAG: alanine racemase [Candidatus Xenobia bacterium]
MPLTWVEVDLSRIVDNVRHLRRIVGPKPQLLAVVKSNAYGHGLIPVARTALGAGASFLGVAAAAEALELRAAGLDAPILLLGPALEEEQDDLIRADVRMAVFDLDTARRLSERGRALGRRALVHVKVDTGLGRLSVTEPQAAAFVQSVAEMPGLQVEGLYTHLADAEGMDQSYTMRQHATFRRIAEAAGVQIPLRHLAGSAAAMLLPELRNDLVRIGISLYGLWPAEETRLLMLSQNRDLLALVNDEAAQTRGDVRQLAFLKPALSWKALLAQVKEVPAHSTVGYGCTFEALRPTRIGVVSIGYADGFDRKLSNNGAMLVRGMRAPIVGRICMNLSMIDVTDIPGATAGDEVVLIGRQGDQELTAEEMANRVGTIHYEIVTRINWSIPRLYPTAPGNGVSQTRETLHADS